MIWFYFAVLASVFWGTENFIHKVVANKGLSSAKMSFIMASTATLLSFITFFIFSGKISNLELLLLIALADSVAFFTSTITKIEALRVTAATVFFPLFRIGSLILMVLLSLLLFQEAITSAQWIGLILSIFAIYLLTWKNKHPWGTSLTSKGLIFLIISTIFVALSNFVGAFASHRFDPYSFSFFSYLIGVPFALVLMRFRFLGNDGQIQKIKSGNNTILLGIALGFFNFLGFIMFLFATKAGSLSIVGAITSLSLLLTLLLSVVIHKERPTKKEALGIVLSISSLVLFNF